MTVQPCAYIAAATDATVTRCGRYGYLMGSGIPICREHRAAARAPDRVYVLLVGGYVKIGTSTDPARRLTEVMAHCNRPPDATGQPVLLTTVLGDRHTEALLHLVLRDYRAEGEWFRRGGPVETLVRWATAQADDALEVTAEALAAEPTDPDPLPPLEIEF